MGQIKGIRMNQLHLENIHKEYEGKLLLKGVNMQVGSDEILCLLGSSGSGKSTILHIIAGIETQESGRVLWNGVDMSNVPVHQRRFGLMFQDYALFPHLNVWENVAFGLRMQRFAREEIKGRVADALVQVNMPGFAQRRVTDLSGGEQQRIALARALACEPQLLMLDEPLAALDRNLRVDLQAELRAVLHASGIPAIYVTHDQDEALFMADRLALLHNGRVVQDGSPDDIFRQPANSWVAGFLAMGNLVHGKVTSLNPLEVETECGKLHLLATTQPRSVNLGENVTVLIKSSSLIKPGLGQTAGSINGMVEENRFLGDRYRIKLGICSGMGLEFVSAHPMPVGEQVTLDLAADEVLLIPE